MNVNNNTKMIFLGLCERAALDREGASPFVKWNILGLKNIVLSYLYPLPIQGLFLGFAMHSLERIEELKVEILNEAGHTVGTISFNDQASSKTVDDNFLPIERETMPMRGVIGSWLPFFVQLNANVMINEPGVYSLILRRPQDSEEIGKILFHAADVLPFTPEKIAAIKSKQHAVKAVMVELGCNHCSTKYSLYAALERTADLSSKYVWYQDSDELFTCDCKKTKMNLSYYKRNLHGLLESEIAADSGINFVPMYERSALNRIYSDFYALLESAKKEEELQKFINDYPILFHQFPIDNLFSKPKILNDHIADFAILTPQKELIFIELEKPATKILKKDGGTHSDLNHAFDQVNDWLSKIDEHRIAILDSLKIERSLVSTIRGVVIAGRDRGHDAEFLRKVKGRSYNRINFLTYDDLGSALGNLISQIKSL